MDQSKAKTRLNTDAFAPAAQRRESERSELDRSGAAGANARPARPDPEARDKPVRRRFTAEYKRSVLERAAQCREAGAIGELLRSEGLYSSHLSKWRQQADSQARRAKAGRPRRPEGVAALQSELASLQAENAKLARRLEQAEAIIEVQKKVSELLGILPPKPSIGRNE